MENGNKINLYLVTISLSTVMVTLGVLFMWLLIAITQFDDDMNLVKTIVDFNMSHVSKLIIERYAGIVVGSLVSGYISDRFGRRATILGSALPIAIGSIIVMFARKLWQLHITLFTWGCGTGMVMTVINYYLSEIADKDVRGKLSVINTLMMRFGIILALTMCPYLSYTTLNIITLVLPFLFFGTCWWIPETPYYYLKSRNVEAARKSLQTLRGFMDDNVLEAELLALKTNVNNEMSKSSSVKELFVGSQYRMAIIMAVGLTVTQILSGVAMLELFFMEILFNLNSNFWITLSPITYKIVSLIAGVISAVLVDRVGRRPLLVFSYIGTGVCLAAVGLYLFLYLFIQIDRGLLITFSFVPLLGIILAEVISSVGVRSISFIPAEIFPMNVKATAMTTLSVFDNVLQLVYLDVFLSFIMSISPTSFIILFPIYTGFAFVGSIFCYFVVIETKGKNLSDIHAELQGDVNPVVVDDKLEEVIANNENEESIKLKEM